MKKHYEKQYDTAFLAELLSHIDPDVHYGDWIKVLMAVFYETQGSDEGLDLVDWWSSQGYKYKGFREVSYKWKSFDLNHPKPVRIGTLIQMANASAY